MIVWLASYPRSGNTFRRIVLHRLYGVPTYVVYDVDGVAQQIGPELMGFRERPADLRPRHLCRPRRPGRTGFLGASTGFRPDGVPEVELWLANGTRMAGENAIC